MICPNYPLSPFTECWTNDLVEDGLLKIENYEMIVRKDRKDTLNGRGAGMLIYVKSGTIAWKV